MELCLLLSLESEHEESLVLAVVKLRNIYRPAQRRLRIMLEISVGSGVTRVDLGVAVFIKVFPVGHHPCPPKLGNDAVDLIRAGFLDRGNETAGGMPILGGRHRAHYFDLLN